MIRMNTNRIPLLSQSKLALIKKDSLLPNNLQPAVVSAGLASHVSPPER